MFFPTANRLSALKQRLKARDDIAAQVVARAAYDSHLRGDDVPKLVTEVSEATSEGFNLNILNSVIHKLQYCTFTIIV